MTVKRFLYFAFVMVLSVFLAFLYYKNYYSIVVAAPDLAHEYSKNIETADKEYLDKRVKVTGQVKAYYKILDTRPVLELKTYEGDLPVFCFFFKNEHEFTASKLREDEFVTIEGKCVGTRAYNFTKGVKIEVKEITPEEDE